MTTEDSKSVDARIAANLRAQRARQGLTLDDLAASAGVSRAMISKIERGDVRPTAVLLARLASALGITLATLFNEENDSASLVRREDRVVWHDPATGYSRRNVGPATAPVDLVDVTLPPGTIVTHDNAIPLNRLQMVWVLDGTLTMQVDGEVHHLAPGDCLQMRLDRPISFQNSQETAVRYAVIVSKVAP